MDVGELITRCRQENKLSLRALAERAGTSHSTLIAYESGRKAPSLATLRRILDAAGYRLTLQVERKPLEFDPEERDREIVGLLELAQLFPTTHSATLDAPIFPRRPGSTAATSRPPAAFGSTNSSPSSSVPMARD